MSQWTAGKLRRIQDENYSPEFPLALALKDVHLALEEAEPEHSPSSLHWLTSGRRSRSRATATRM